MSLLESRSFACGYSLMQDVNLFLKYLLNLNDFIVDDPASHLKYKISYPKYASYILEVLEKEIN